MVTSFSKDDARYASLTRGNNARWVGQPEQIYVPTSAKEAKEAFDEITMRSGKFAVRSGGHCYVDSVDKTFDTQYSIIDLGLMNRIEYDNTNKAISVEAGCRLGEVYKYLFRQWGVTIPGGSCGTVGVGGHVSGGGYGLLSRLYGITVDHLWGIEVIDANGDLKICSHDSGNQAERDLWWAHTGGGGGNFGLVTRFLFRSPNSPDGGEKPENCLPKAPARVLLMTVKLPWGDATENDRTKLTEFLSQFGEWCAAQAERDLASDRLFGLFRVKAPGSVVENDAVHLTAQVAQLSNDEEDTQKTQNVLAEFRSYAGVNVALKQFKGRPGVFDHTDDLPWLEATQQLSGGDWYDRAKQKSAFHRTLTAYHAQQIIEQFADRPLPGTGDRIPGGRGALVSLDTYGGEVNRGEALETAYSHRDSTIKVQYQSYWGEPSEDYDHLNWLDVAYQHIYAESNGLPEPAREKDPTNSEVTTDGCFVNYLDDDLPADVGDERFYGRLYWGPRTFAKLQHIKRDVDPNGVFTSAQPIPPAENPKN
jgi:hypothetical protein